MYADKNQLRIEDFVFPYGELDSENDWVRLAALVPWEMAEERYATRFVNNGHPAHPARMALGALLIQRRLKCSDRWLVKHVGENLYLQLFHRNEGVRAVSIWSIHAGGVPETVQRGRPGGNTGSISTKSRGKR